MAEGAVPVHVLPVGHGVAPRLTRQPLLSRAHVTNPVVPWQVVPTPFAHSVGVAGHLHMAFGAAPWQVSPAVHGAAVMTVTHPLVASTAHVTSCPSDRHDFPAPAEQSAGRAPHEQLADGAFPVHGFPAGHVTGASATKHPQAFIEQDARVCVS